VIRTAWVALHLVLATAPLSIAAILGPFFRASDHYFDRIPRIWARWLLWATGVRVSVQGAEHVVAGRPQIVASNHVSWFDVISLAAILPKRYRFVAKQELGRIPLFGRAWKAAGHIAIDRSDTQRAVESLDRAGRLVREDGSAIVIFPEGTRSATGALQPFKKGAFMLALHTGVDIVPTAVIGSRAIMRKDSWRVQSGRIIVRFGPPIRTADYEAGERDRLMSDVRTAIMELLAAPPPTD
jgi:1-acyl-sn-glycerol-3-phosphate acyltransferase